MKTTLIALFVGSLVAIAVADSKDRHSKKEGEHWNLPEPAYGQFRIVPSRTIPHVAEEKTWNGPWSTFKSFVIELDFSEGHQTSPLKYSFVDPRVGLRGSKSGSEEAHSTTVRLFDRESKEEDINITFEAPPDKINLNQEYHAATISGDDSIVTWNVFVRFTKAKPNYIRASVPTQ